MARPEPPPATITKRLYTLGNFSKFVRPGFVRVGTSGGPGGVYVSAYKDPVANTVATLAISNEVRMP